MATDLEASRLMVRHGARMITEKAPNYTKLTDAHKICVKAAETGAT